MPIVLRVALILGATTIALSPDFVKAQIPPLVPERRPQDPSKDPKLPILDDLPQPELDVEPPSVPQDQLTLPAPIVVSEFLVKGNTVISTEEIQAVMQPYTNVPINSDDLLAAQSAVGKLYFDKGYITSFAQFETEGNEDLDIDDLKLTVTIYEGRLDEISVRGTKRLKPYVKQRLKAEKSGVINEDRIKGSLSNLLSDPRIKSISTTFTTKGLAPFADLKVDVTPANPVKLSVGLNNNRSPFVGTFERWLEFRHLNVFGFGDEFRFVYQNTDASNAFRFGYVIPVNPQNGKVSIEYQKVISEVQEEPFDVLELEGDLDDIRLTFRQPVFQRATANLREEFALGVTASYQCSSLTSPFIPFAISRGADENGQTCISALRFTQDWLQIRNKSAIGATSQFNLGLGIAATDNPTPPDGYFFSWQGSGRWINRLSDRLTVSVRGDLQFADRALLPAEQFALGGVGTLPGYRQNLLLSDNALLFSLGLDILAYSGRVGRLTFTPFVGVGYGWDNSSSLVPSPGLLASGGVGVRYQLRNNLELFLTYGIPFVNRPQIRNSLQEQGLHLGIKWNILP